jgi:hypothetical protein
VLKMVTNATIANHPAFLAFKGANIPASNGETQVQDTEKAINEVKNDQQYANTNNGGELGKAE